MSTTTTAPDVPLPGGAVRVHEWERPEVTGYPESARFFVGASRTVDIEQQRGGNIEVTVDGTQWADGRIERWITVYQMHPDSPAASGEARKIAAALIECADEADRWATR
jgi:hypothetical protein